MAVIPIQEGFTGELSRRLRGHVSAPFYRTGLDYCENFRPTPQGSLLMRSGTEKVSVLAYTEPRFICFRMADEQDYLIVLGDYEMEIYKIDGSTISSVYVVSTELIQNGDFSMWPDESWTVSVHANSSVSGLHADGYVLGYLRFWQLHMSDAAVGASKVITTPFASDLHIKFTISSFFDGTGSGKAVAKLGTTPGASDLYYWEGENGTIEADVVGLAAGTYYLSFWTKPDGSSESMSFNLDDLSIIATNSGVGANIASPWPLSQIEDVRYAVETGADRVIMFHRSAKPFLLEFKSAGAWNFGSLIFSNAPAEWDPEWPEMGEIYASRLWVAIRNRVWGSRSGELADFSLGTGAAGDALDFKAATPGAARWLRGHRRLLLGTDLGEHSIGAPGELITPTNTQVNDESAFGGAKIQSISIGAHAAFVTADRREVRILQYEQQTGGWDSKALSFLAEHLFQDRHLGAIKEIHHLRCPEGTLLVLCESGNFAVCTLDLEQGIIAWWRLTFGAEVLTASVSQGPAGAFLWMAVKRSPADIILEKLCLNDIEDLPYLDCSIAVASVPAGGDVTFDHLPNGTVVRAVVDGAVAGDFTVTAGKVSLGEDAEGKSAVIGVAYTAKATSLPLNLKMAKAQNAKIGVMLNNSALPKMGNSNSKLYRAADRKPSTQMDTPSALRDGKVTVGAIGVDDEAKITIEQDLPFRTEILALYSVTEV